MKIINTSPIKASSLNLFSGRTSELEQLQSLFNSFNLVIIEGEFGVGKTSLGNYYRLSSKKWLTPEEEISTDFSWSSKDFLHEVLKSTLNAILKEDKLNKDLFLRPFVLRYTYLLDLDVNVKFFGVVNLQKEESSAEVQTVAGLKEDFEKLTQWVEGKGFPMLIQLNNLDLENNSSKEKEMLKFFDLNRNIFQINSMNWILTGSRGLRDFFEKNLVKFGSLLIDPLVLEPLTEDEMMDTVKKRKLDIFQDRDLKFVFSVEQDFRSVLRKLSNWKENPQAMTLLEIKPLEDKDREVMKSLGLSLKAVKDIAQDLGVSQKTTQERIKSLLLRKVIREVKNQNKNGFVYGISFEAYHSLYIKKVDSKFVG